MTGDERVSWRIGPIKPRCRRAFVYTNRVLLTHKEIWDYFGASRATVVRRMRDGLIPGIRLQHGRVLEDGPIRRFSRAQVRWLLLAVRRGWRG